MAAPAASGSPWRWAKLALLLALLVACVAISVDVWRVLDHQPRGIDFMPLWTGARVALVHPERLYDFRHITDLQGWPLGPRKPRPFVYPPTTALVLAPFAALPEPLAYVLFMALSGGLLAWTAHRAGGRWWLLLLPCITLVVFCGQLTLLLAALALAALSRRERPVLAGALLGLAAAIKPQLFVFAPLALIAARQWRTLLASGVAGAVLAAIAAAVFGPQAFLDWLAALPRFNAQVFGADRSLLADAASPYAALEWRGLPGPAAFLLAVPALGLVWLAFRSRADAFDRSIALFAAALAITPYAMNYEVALFAPAVAAYLARATERAWPAYFLLGGAYCGLSLVHMPAVHAPLLQELAVIALPCVRLAAARCLPAAPSRPA